MTGSQSQSFLSGMLALASIILLGLSAGCSTMTNPLSTESRINRYLAKHPDRPIAIQQALRARTLCKGMNQQEVTFCWGSPITKETIEENGVRGEVWSYAEHRKGGTDTDHGSSLFDYSVPLGCAVLMNTSTGLSLSKWTVYGEPGETSGSGAPTDASRPATAKTPAGGTEQGSTAANLPKLTPSPDLSRWPALRVTGILKSGQSQTALINNTVVSAGETIEGATVLAVSPTGVYLQYGSETIVLTKGRETHPPPSSGGGFFK